MDNNSTTRPRWGVFAAAGAALAGFAAVITAIELMAVRGQLDFGLGQRGRVYRAPRGEFRRAATSGSVTTAL